MRSVTTCAGVGDWLRITVPASHAMQPTSVAFWQVSVRSGKKLPEPGGVSVNGIGRMKCSRLPGQRDWLASGTKLDRKAELGEPPRTGGARAGANTCSWPRVSRRVSADSNDGQGLNSSLTELSTSLSDEGGWNCSS